MRVLDLFSGIGGFSLGLERAGMTTAMFCEIEPFCRRVLAKHWPGVPIHDDVRTLDRLVVAEKAGAVDLVCGGFPCQDISVAGKGAGLDGDRSGLWFEYRRIIEEVAPRWVVIENVPALRSRGLDTVLGGLAALGYDTEWHCIPACALGAPHRRDRVWVVAHAEHRGRQGRHEDGGGAGAALPYGATVARAARDLRAGTEASGDESGFRLADGGEYVAHANGDGGAPRHLHADEGPGGRNAGGGGVGAHRADSILCGQSLAGQFQLGGSEAPGRNWEADPADAHGAGTAESHVGRVAYGVPSRVDRLRSLGNAVVPQIVEVIGRAIMAAEAGR